MAKTPTRPACKHIESNKRILVVDDEKSIRELFSAIIALQIANCRVDFAINGAEAIEMFRDGHHSVIVMDVHMPVMDGEAAFLEIEKICDSEQSQMPSVIFCTGHLVSDKICAIVKGDARHCLLRKPVDHEHFVKAITERIPG